MIVKMRNSGIVLFICSGLLLTGGVILGATAGWQVLRMSYYFWTTDFGVELGAGVQLVAGAMLCLPACWLASLVPYHPRSFYLISTMMFLATASMVVLCIGLSSLGGLSRVLRDPAMVNSSMHRALAKAQADHPMRGAFAAMQLELRCCGINGPTDWIRYRQSLPPACCNRWVQSSRDAIKHEAPCDLATAVYTSGCLLPAMGELQYYVNSQAVLTATMIFVLGVTLFATAYTLVVGLLEPEGASKLRPSQPLMTSPLRIACVRAPLYSVLPDIQVPSTPNSVPLPPA